MLRLLSKTCGLQRAGGRLLSSTNDRNPLERAVRFSVGDKLHGYTVRGVTAVQDFDLVAVQLTHDQTNAQHLHLARNDSNNAFGVGFRTTPMDSTGVAHVLEHTVLCGSHKYPVRDPFFKMLNRSLATFMNAFTANDWTLYPFSTQNEKDYYNLMSVYMDCVFHPLLRELDFRQEGWRLEHEDPTDPKSPITFKGVVFNEMKGVFADPESIYAQTLQNKLYPSHTYSHVSGGDPLDILDLTWEKLKHFHGTHYHPSNSRFITYGDLPLPTHLNHIHSEVLQNYQQSRPSEEVPLEPRWSQPVEHWITCPVDSLTGDQYKQTFVGVSFLLSPITDPYESLCLLILCQLLVDGPASPFYQALIDSHIGTEYIPNTGYDNSTKEASFSVGLQGVRMGDVQKVKDMIWSTLENVASEGFSQERVSAVLHQIELRLKHQTSNFGVSLMMSLLSPWIHDGNPADLLQVNQNIQRFKEECEDPAFFRNMISHYFLNNKHHLTLVMEPDEKYASQRKSKESEKLHLTLSHLSVCNKDEVYKKGLDLLSYQNFQENAESLPSLNISDVDQNIRCTHLDHDHAGGVPVQFSQQPTNGVTYFRALSGIALLPESLKIYVPLFCNAITQMGTDSYDHRQFAQQCDLYTGGFAAGCHVSTYHSSLTKTEQGVLLSSHCLDDNLTYMLNLWEELFCCPTIHDEQRLRTIINITANNMVLSVAKYGHQFAMSAASSGLTPAASLSEVFTGITQVNFLKKMTELDDLTEVEHKLASVAAEVLDCGSFRCAINCSASNMTPVCQAMDGFIATLPGKSADISSLVEHNDFQECHNVLKYDLNLPVNYVGYSLKTVPFQHEDSPRLDVLAILMKNKYLHREVREKGGAYGTGAIHGGGLFSFFSYRDPNSHATLKAFRQCIEWAMEGKFSDEDVNEARLSLFSKIDYPVSPGSRGTQMFLHHISDEMRQEYRQKIFKASKADVIDVAMRYLKSDVSGCAVIGGSDLK